MSDDIVKNLFDKETNELFLLLKKVFEEMMFEEMMLNYFLNHILLD